MKTTYLKYIALPALCLVLFSCELEKSEKPRPAGTGITILKNAVEVVEDYIWFAKVPLAVIHYSAATTEEKINLLNTVFDGYRFAQIDDAWEVEIYWHGRFYVKFVNGDDGELSVIDVTRLREYDDDEKPVFDTCYLYPLGESKWKLVAHDVHNNDRYPFTRDGKCELILEAAGGPRTLPDIFSISGSGAYTSGDLAKNIVEVDWEIQEGTAECFSREYYRTLIQAEIYVECGRPAGKKDKVEARFNRAVPEIELKLNGKEENANPYF